MYWSLGTGDFVFALPLLVLRLPFELLDLPEFEFLDFAFEAAAIIVWLYLIYTAKIKSARAVINIGIV
jgi:hypothetical protein